MTQNPAIAPVMRGEANVGPLSTTFRTFAAASDRCNCGQGTMSAVEEIHSRSRQILPERAVHQ